MHIITHQTSPTSQLTANKDAPRAALKPPHPTIRAPPTLHPPRARRPPSEETTRTHTSNEQPSTHKTQAPARPTPKETPGRPDRSTARSGHRTAKRVQQQQKKPTAKASTDNAETHGGGNNEWYVRQIPTNSETCRRAAVTGPPKCERCAFLSGSQPCRYERQRKKKYAAMQAYASH